MSCSPPRAELQLAGSIRSTDTKRAFVSKYGGFREAATTSQSCSASRCVMRARPATPVAPITSAVFLAAIALQSPGQTPVEPDGSACPPARKGPGHLTRKAVALGATTDAPPAGY